MDEQVIMRLSGLRKIHDIKIDSSLFYAVSGDMKTHEFRRNDRDYGVGDLLVLRSWDTAKGAYVKDGDYVLARVNFISKGPDWGIPAGYCVMSIKVVGTGADNDLPF